MRGTLGERNPSQMALGRTTAGTLELLGVQAFPLSDPADVVTLAKGAMAVAEAPARWRRSCSEANWISHESDRHRSRDPQLRA
jgi:sulfopyruvate decarboxylase TPP-binding subunit